MGRPYVSPKLRQITDPTEIARVAALMNGPRYRHDCNRCRFLGTFRAHDLYFCKGARGTLWPTVIARWGDEGPEYVSGLPLAAHDPILAHALSIVETGEATEWITAADDYGRTEGAMWARTLSELVEGMLHARKRATMWKRFAKWLWAREVPGKLGRYHCAARDVKMKRRGL